VDSVGRVTPQAPLANVLLDLLRDEGVDRIFGNPGTTEIPLIRALTAAGEPAFVLALHEQAAMAMADGYARATGRPGFVSLHAAAGLANGMLGLVNALRSRTPMVVLCCQQDRRHLAQGPMLGGDLVGMAGAVAVAAQEVHRAEDVAVVLRRAFARARTAPRGPVFVSVPTDLLDEPVPPAPAASPVPALAVSPDVPAAAEVLAGARRPALMAGDRVGQGGAVAELTALAETLGATVYPQPMFDAVDADTEHPLTAPPLPPDNAVVRQELAGHDVVLFAGVTIRPHYYRPGNAVPDDVVLLQLDTDPAEIGRNHPVRAGLLGAIGPTLEELRAHVLAVRTPDAARAAERRLAQDGALRTQQRQSWRLESAALGGPAPMHRRAAVQAVADALPPGTALVEEAITASPDVRRAFRLRRPGDYHHTVGGGLGWGVGAAVGVQLAQPGRPVVAVLGDGATMFGVQGLWSAAAQRVPVVLVVLDNQEYRAVREPVGTAEAARFVGVDLKNPRIDWPGLARSFGVTAVTVSHTCEIGPAVEKGLAGPGPTLVHVPVLGYAAQYGQEDQLAINAAEGQLSGAR
jgi:benzoylformate decarboxylase